jgi:hypothetical protein
VQIHNLGAVAVCRYRTVVDDRTRGKVLTRAQAEELFGRRRWDRASRVASRRVVLPVPASPTMHKDAAMP